MVIYARNYFCRNEKQQCEQDNIKEGVHIKQYISGIDFALMLANKRTHAKQRTQKNGDEIGKVMFGNSKTFCGLFQCDYSLPRTARPMAFATARRRDPIGMSGSTILRIGLSSPTARSCFGRSASSRIFGSFALTTRLSRRS